VLKKKHHQDPVRGALAVFDALSREQVKQICSEHGISAAQFKRWREQCLASLTQILEEGAAKKPARVAAAASPAEAGALEASLKALPDQVSVAKGLIEIFPYPVFIKGRDGRYLALNKAWEDFLGVKREDYIGKKVDDLYSHIPELGKKHRLMDDALWASGGNQVYEATLTTRDGQVRYGISYKSTFANAEGEIAGMVGTVIDITARRKAQQRQEIEHEVMRLLGGHDSLSEVMQGVIRVICEQLDWACGARWALDAADGDLHCIEIWGDADPKIAAFLMASRGNVLTPIKSGLVRNVLATGASMWIADVSQRKDFLRATLAANAGLRGAFAMPVLIGDRVLGAIEFFSRDVHKPDDWLLEVVEAVGNQVGQYLGRRQAEAATYESEARFRSLTELSSDWYWEQDKELRFTLVSRGILDRTGIPPESFVGKRRWDADVNWLPEGDWEEHKAVLAARGAFHDFECACVNQNGETHYLSISGMPVFDEEGDFAGYRGVGKDITMQRAAEAKLRAAHEEVMRKARELIRSNDELQQFAYVASHDLQEPLRMISSYTQLLERRYGKQFDSDAREFMEFIVDGAARMKDLIEDLLAYSRVGTRGREFAPVEAEGALRKALANLRAAIESEGATVTHEKLPAVIADSTQLVQLLQNLIANAIKFHGPEAPRIHIGAAERETAWEFSVKDNGIGIEPQYFERIFMMFQRLHSKEEYPGTGIGLAICKKIIDRHGGKIRVESQPGMGSTFYFTLPKRGEEQVNA
jgi:PAS domain S-box-containing protein